MAAHGQFIVDDDLMEGRWIPRCRNGVKTAVGPLFERSLRARDIAKCSKKLRENIFRGRAMISEGRTIECRSN